MDATLKLKAEQLAGEIARQAQTLDDLNGLFRTLMKSALERMLDTEMDVHLGRKTIVPLAADEARASDPAVSPQSSQWTFPKNQAVAVSHTLFSPFQRFVPSPLRDVAAYQDSGYPVQRRRGGIPR